MSRSEARAGTATTATGEARLPVALALRPLPPFAAGDPPSCPLRTVDAVAASDRAAATAAPASADTGEPG